MIQLTIEEAVQSAQREFLGMSGVTGISHDGKTIIFYVGTAEDAQRIPSSYMGYSVRYIISGPFRVL